MKHIPYRLLDGSCILRLYGETDIFGGRDILSETELKRVRIELFRRKKSSADGETFFSYGRIYYDCGRSIPEEAAFSSEGDMSVIISGEEFRISEIRYHYDRKRLKFISLELEG